MIFGLELDLKDPSYLLAIAFFERAKDLFNSGDPINLFLKREIYPLGMSGYIIRTVPTIPDFSLFLLIPIALGFIFQIYFMVWICAIIFLLIKFVWKGIIWIPVYMIALKKTGYKGPIKYLNKEKVLEALLCRN